jgi:ParB/RepB/Spo0J family partition protein
VQQQLEKISLNQIKESTTNPRKHFEPKAMAELVASVTEKGLIVPPLVRPFRDGHYEIVAGARRFRAAKQAKLSEIFCIVRELTDDQALEIQVIENLQREDVHPLEEAEGYRQLLDRATHDFASLAAKVGKSESYIHQRIKLRDLIAPAKKMFLEEALSLGHAQLLCRLQTAQQKEAIAWISRGDSVRGFRSEIYRHFHLRLKNAVFNTEDPQLVPAAGACEDCPKRTGANPGLFSEIKEADTCTDPSCFQQKENAFVKIQVGTHPDAEMVSIGRRYPEEIRGLSPDQWLQAGTKKCDSVLEAVIVQSGGEEITYGDKKGLRLGQVLSICRNSKCRVHREVSDYNPNTGGSRKADKARKIELRRRGLVFKELASEPFTVAEKDYRAILDHMIVGLGHDHAKALCDAMGWDVPKSETGHGQRSYDVVVKEKLAKLSPEGIEQWLYLLTLAESELWFYTFSKISSKLLDAKAKATGVPLAAIAKESKQPVRKGIKAGTCRHCGCTEKRACRYQVKTKDFKGPRSCSWVDATKTVCSNPICVKKEASRKAKAA